MNCSNCGAEVADTAKFCAKCGAAVKAGKRAPRKRKNAKKESPITASANTYSDTQNVVLQWLKLLFWGSLVCSVLSYLVSNEPFWDKSPGGMASCVLGVIAFLLLTINVLKGVKWARVVSYAWALLLVFFAFCVGLGDASESQAYNVLCWIEAITFWVGSVMLFGCNKKEVFKRCKVTNSSEGFVAFVVLFALGLGLFLCVEDAKGLEEAKRAAISDALQECYAIQELNDDDKDFSVLIDILTIEELEDKAIDFDDVQVKRILKKWNGVIDELEEDAPLRKLYQTLVDVWNGDKPRAVYAIWVLTLNSEEQEKVLGGNEDKKTIDKEAAKIPWNSVFKFGRVVGKICLFVLAALVSLFSGIKKFFGKLVGDAKE